MKYLIAIIFSILLTLPPVQAAEKQVVPVTGTLVFSGLQNSELGLMVEEVLRQAYRQIGIEIETKWLPGARALEMANDGEVDGAQLRVAGIRKKYSNLLMIPIPVYVTEILAFSKNRELPVRKWADLKPYRLGVPGGYTAILDNVQGFQCWLVSYEQIFRMLDENRVDIGITDRFNAMVTIRKLGLKGIRAMEPPLSHIRFYNFLHKKHENIMAGITASLQRMHEDGRIREIWKRFETESAKEKP